MRDILRDCSFRKQFISKRARQNIFLTKRVSRQMHVNNYTVLAQYNELLVPHHNGTSPATALKKS